MVSSTCFIRMSDCVIKELPRTCIKMLYSLCLIATRHLQTLDPKFGWQGSKWKTGGGLGRHLHWLPVLPANRPGLHSCDPVQMYKFQLYAKAKASALSLSRCLSQLLSHPHWICIPGHIPCKHHSWSTECSCGHQWPGPRSQASPRESRQESGWAGHRESAPTRLSISEQLLGQWTLTLAFCCRVSLLMEMRLLDLASPITTHQPSSRFCSDQKPRISAHKSWQLCNTLNNKDFKK